MRGRVTLPAAGVAGAVAALAAFIVALTACSPSPKKSSSTGGFAAARQSMVRTQVEARGIRGAALLRAMNEIPRELFVEPRDRAIAYEDRPVSIGEGQTSPQPYIAALMAQLLDIQPTDRILEVGTGSGYQAAVLSRMAKEVYTIEILPGLSARANGIITGLGIHNVEFRVGDGYGGWPEEAPFDGILVSAAPRQTPPALLAQLAPNGRMVIPVGDFYQELEVFAKDSQGNVSRHDVLPVRFTPMSGQAQQQENGHR